MAALDLNLVSILAFCALAVFLLWRDRDNIERHTIVFVRRTQEYIHYLDDVANINPRLWRHWANLGIVVGFAAMAFIVGTLLVQTVKMFLVADAAPAVTPILPTVDTMTDPMEAGYWGIPFWHFLISISIVMIIHEMMHGVIARVEDFDIEYVGLILLGIIPGAFVQPKGQRDIFEPKPEGEEKESPWDQGDWKARLRVLAAGPFANITLAVLIALVFFAVFATPNGTYEPKGFYEHEGIRVLNTTAGYDAAASGIEPGMVITGVNGQQTLTMTAFQQVMRSTQPGDDLALETAGNGTYDVSLGRPPSQDLRYQPAVIDHILVPLERRVPGTITTYESVNDVVLNDDLELRKARWDWIRTEYDGLDAVATERIAALDQQIADRDEHGYLGIIIAPEATLKAQYEPYMDVIFIVFQLLFTIMAINLGIGMANLIPIKGLDGGWMLSILLDEHAPRWEPKVTRWATILSLGAILFSLGFVILRALL